MQICQRLSTQPRLKKSPSTSLLHNFALVLMSGLCSMHFFPISWVTSTFQAGNFLPSLCFAATNAIKAQISFVIKLKLIKSVFKYERIGFNFNDLQIFEECVLLSGLRSTIPSASSIVKFGQVQYFNFELLCPSFFSPVSQWAGIWKGSFHSPPAAAFFCNDSGSTSRPLDSLS